MTADRSPLRLLSPSEPAVDWGTEAGDEFVRGLVLQALYADMVTSKPCPMFRGRGEWMRLAGESDGLAFAIAGALGLDEVFVQEAFGSSYGPDLNPGHADAIVDELYAVAADRFRYSDAELADGSEARAADWEAWRAGLEVAS